MTTKPPALGNSARLGDSYKITPHLSLFLRLLSTIICFQQGRAQLFCYLRQIRLELNNAVWISQRKLLPTSISQAAEELHKHEEEILINAGLVKSIPDNPHNTKTNSISLVVTPKKGHSQLSFVH